MQVMADQDELFYLQPGFDLSSLTVPRLRSILVSHDVGYPSSAKKQDLLDILEAEVLPKSKKLLSAQARVRRTSKGITDVPSAQDEAEDRQLMPPPKTPRGRKSRTNLQSEDGIVSTPKTARRSKTPSTRRKTIQASDTETDAPAKTPRRSRNEINPDELATQVKFERTETRQCPTTGESPFSDDNPFQSGSSPPSGPKQVQPNPRKSEDRRRSTKSPTIKQEHAEYELPVAKLSVDHNGVETSEAFTEDAGRELLHDMASDKSLAKARNSALTRHRRKPTSTAAKTAPFAVLTLVTAALASWYRQEKINVGYCGIGDQQWSLASNPNIPLWVHENLQPACEPCPTHAMCYPAMEVRCDDDFVLRPHPMSLNELVPLPPTCEPDNEKQRRIKAVADRAVEELRDRRADYECGTLTATEVAESSSESTEPTMSLQTKLEVTEETLKRQVGKMRRRGMTEDEFNDLWRGALDDIINREEVEVVREESRMLLKSNSLARLPIICAIRRSFFRAVSAYRIPLTILIFVLGGMGYGRHRITSFQQAKGQTPSLVAMTLDRLATQAALKENERVSEGFISVGQLRDDVLRHVFSAAERERAWQRVRKIVEGNSNVRASTREGGKTGEWSRVWEWIGPVDLAAGLEGRKAGQPRGSEASQDRLETRKWDEGRPIY